MSGDPDDQIYLEMTRIGASQEVRAISAHDGLEVAFVAPSSATSGEVEHLARAKLGWLRRKLSGADKVNSEDGDGGASGGGPGKGGLIA